MTISTNIRSFFGLQLHDFSPDKGISNPDTTAYKISLTWDDSEAGKNIVDSAKQLLADPNIGKLRALVIGSWGECYDNSPQALIDLLVAEHARLGQLQAIFFGEMVMEECEVSWIEQGSYAEFLQAFPNLRHFQVRGSNSLDIGLKRHEQLQTLIIECGGLPSNQISAVAQANLPELRHLELWLGSSDYGYDGSMKEIQELLSQNFPKLEYLGLRDAEIADELAAVVAKADILKQISTLDLSLGNLSDTGAIELLNSPYIALIEKLDLHHHFISDAICKKFDALGIAVDLSDKQDEDEYDGETYRYIAVSE